MIYFRSFRNGDPPALAALWNRGIPALGTVRPLSGQGFDAQVIEKPHFEAAGLIVAEREGKVVGFAHAGFGPSEPIGAPHQLCNEMGTIAMLVVEPGPENPELERRPDRRVGALSSPSRRVGPLCRGAVPAQPILLGDLRRE